MFTYHQKKPQKYEEIIQNDINEMKREFKEFNYDKLFTIKNIFIGIIALGLLNLLMLAILNKLQGANKNTGITSQIKDLNQQQQLAIKTQTSQYDILQQRLTLMENELTKLSLRPDMCQDFARRVDTATEAIAPKQKLMNPLMTAFQKFKL